MQKKIATALFVVLSVLYPCLVYFGLQHWSYRVFGVMIIAVGVGKYFLSRTRHTNDLLVLAVTMLCGVAIWLFPSELVVKIYPVCIGVLLGSLFAFSLRQPESLIERLARLSGAEMTPAAVRYTRRLTGIWAILLYVNALVALYLARFGTTQAWTFYCGFLSYVIFGIFMGGELLFRQFYMRRQRVQQSDSNPI